MHMKGFSMKGGSSRRRKIEPESETASKKAVSQEEKRIEVNSPLKNEQADSTCPNSPLLPFEFFKKSENQKKTIDDVNFLDVYLRDRWKQLAEELEHNDPEELFKLCRAKWFKSKSSLSRKNPEILEKPYCIYSKEEMEQGKGNPKNFVVLLKHFLKHIDLNNELFSIDFIEKTYGDFITDTRVQVPLAEGFNVRSTRYHQEVGEMELSEYVQYQRKKQNMNLQDKSTLEEKITFAVNLDIGNFKEQLTELHNKVPSWLYCNRDEDLQGYLRKHIPGMSVPQIYLKVAGCWTGGHQENLALRAVNINHGPGEVEWFCMDPDETVRFNNHILKEKGHNFLALEGLWYLSLEEVLSRGFKVTKFVQEEGDIVILAPGTLHWVKSYAMTVNSAWNIGYYEKCQFDEILRRFDFNNRVGFRNLIPVRTLLLDILNNEARKLDRPTFEMLKERVIKFVNKALDNFEIAKRWECQREEDNKDINNMVMCSRCFGETFESWFYDKTKDSDDVPPEFDVDNIICFDCARDKKVNRKKIIWFMKYNKPVLTKVMQMLEDLSFKDIKKTPFPLMTRIATPKYYVKSTVSEYFGLEGEELVPLKSDELLVEEPVDILKQKNFLSRKSMLNMNTFVADALSIKIKLKSKREFPEDEDAKRSEEKKSDHEKDPLNLIQNKLASKNMSGLLTSNENKSDLEDWQQKIIDYTYTTLKILYDDNPPVNPSQKTSQTAKSQAKPESNDLTTKASPEDNSIPSTSQPSDKAKQVDDDYETSSHQASIAPALDCEFSIPAVLPLTAISSYYHSKIPLILNSTSNLSPYISQIKEDKLVSSENILTVVLILYESVFDLDDGKFLLIDKKKEELEVQAEAKSSQGMKSQQAEKREFEVPQIKDERIQSAVRKALVQIAAKEPSR